MAALEVGGGAVGRPRDRAKVGGGPERLGPGQGEDGFHHFPNKPITEAVMNESSKWVKAQGSTLGPV